MPIFLLNFTVANLGRRLPAIRAAFHSSSQTVQSIDFISISGLWDNEINGVNLLKNPNRSLRRQR